MRSDFLSGRGRARRGARLAAAALGLSIIAATVGAPAAGASELVTLNNGFDLVCDHAENVGHDGGEKVRLYLASGGGSFVEFGASEIASIAPVPLRAATQPKPDDRVAPPQGGGAGPPRGALKASPTPGELREMLAAAGAQHNLEADLLASIVHAESGGNVRAVSRAGARGLMQLMPRTAAELGVGDSFGAEENLRGGTTYLNSLLTKYRDNLALALAAYNAGPAAVARWHGVPPYRETRAYVARVIREFNARSQARPGLDRREAGVPLASNSRTAAALDPAAPGGDPFSLINKQSTH